MRSIVFVVTLCLLGAGSTRAHVERDLAPTKHEIGTAKAVVKHVTRSDTRTDTRDTRDTRVARDAAVVASPPLSVGRRDGVVVRREVVAVGSIVRFGDAVRARGPPVA